MRHTTRIILLLCIAAALSVGCSDSSTESSDPQTVGPDGGSLTGPGLMTLDIPLGALGETVTFTVIETSMPASEDDYRQVSRFYRITPEGVAFAVPATLKIPYNPEMLAPSQTAADVMLWREGDADALLQLETANDTDAAVVTGALDRTGVVGAAAAFAGETPGEGALTLPELADFDLVAVGQSASQALIVDNSGDGPVEVSALTLGGDAAFALDGVQDGFTLEAGASRQITVTYSPDTQAAHTATLTIASDLADSPHTIALSGRGAGNGTAALSDDELDFGAVALGEDATSTVEIENSSTDGALIIFGIKSPDDVFTVQADALPIRIEPGASTTLSIRFAPTQAQQYEQSLDVYVDDLEQSVWEIKLRGEGI